MWGNHTARSTAKPDAVWRFTKALRTESNANVLRRTAGTHRGTYPRRTRTQLEQLKSEEEALHNEFEVDSLTKLRERLIEQDRSADETRAVRNAASTWEALQTIRL
ncbi:DUF7342 family protein [Halobacterium salinarum]